MMGREQSRALGLNGGGWGGGGEVDLSTFQEDKSNYGLFPFCVPLAFWGLLLNPLTQDAPAALYCENSPIAISCSSASPATSLRSKISVSLL